MTKAEEILNRHFKNDKVEHMLGKYGATYLACLKAVNEALTIPVVGSSLPSKQDMWTKRTKEIIKIEESNTSHSKHTPYLLGFALGFEKCYKWMIKKG